MMTPMLLVSLGAPASGVSPTGPLGFVEVLGLVNASLEF